MVGWEGQQFGNYRLVALLGQGSYAQVYLGQHVRLDLQAAIKVLHTHLTGSEAERFQHEAETIARLAHPSIVRILDYDVQDGVPFLVMDYALGGSLRRRYPKESQVPLPLLMAAVKQVAAALQYAHDHKVIHRDVKPENLLLGRQEEVLLSDFGLAILAQSLSSLNRSAQGTAGTIAYMAPEQIEGHPRAASDQYALGVVVYEWLCGVRPFEGSATEVIVKHVSMPPPPLHERVPTISPIVEQVVLRALAKEPNDRFASVADFALALEQACGEDTSGQTLSIVTSGYPTEAGDRASSRSPLPTGTVTLLFTDIEGSTSLLQQVGEQYADMLVECRDVLRAAFHQWNGREVGTQGDSFFVVFALATDAIAAVVAMQRALVSHAWPSGVEVRVRMGLHTGEPSLVTEDYVGLDVHHAARIMSVGHGGQVLLSQTTHELVKRNLPEGVSMRDLGEHRLKDLQRPGHLYQLIIADLPADFPPLKTLDNSPNNLPIQLTQLIGRKLEMATVLNFLQREEVRLLTLTGPGGTGKTRLALQVAAELNDRFADGIFFVNLDPLSDPELVVPTIAQTLDIKEIADQTLLNLLKASLHWKQVLLLLDNFEQVIDAAVYVAELLAACPMLKVLVTSRAALHIQGEQEFAVPPLAVPDPKRMPDLKALSQYEAVALFTQRAQAVKPEFQVTTANAQAIAEICVRLDGLPLAIELAAARSKLLPPQALLARLGQRLTVLTSKAPDVPARQQTLRNTIEWSYDLLDEEEQRLFRLLSAFVGGCTLEAIETIWTTIQNEAEQVLESVSSLLDKSLVRQTEREGVGPRLTMLETVREYGLEMLATSGEVEITQRAHAVYYLAVAEEAVSQLGSPRWHEWLERLEEEHDNLRAVMQWVLEPGRQEEQHLEMALRLGAALGRFWFTRGPFHEGQIFLERALAGSEGIVSSWRAKALIAAGWLEDDIHRRDELFRESLAIVRALGDKQGIASSLYWLSLGALDRGNPTEASAMLEESMQLQRELGDTGNLAYSLYMLAHVAAYQGDYARASALSEESLALHRKREDTRGIPSTLLYLAEISFCSHGDPSTVRPLIEESVTLAKQLGDTQCVVYCLTFLGWVELSQGNVPLARSLIEKTIALCREMGLPSGGVWVLGPEVVSKVAAEHVFKRAAAQGDYATARAHLEEGVTLARELGAQLAMAAYLDGLASVVATQGELTWAARLWGVAQSLREASGQHLAPDLYTGFVHEQAIPTTCGQLGEEAFAKALAEGRAMTLEQVLVSLETIPLPEPAPAGLPSASVASLPPPHTELTPREIEVLLLVAQGMTNEQVAEQLIISSRTVNTHLTSIYGKIGVSSRAAATRYAIEHHLA